MIDLLDDALREYLIKELPVRDNEIDISFDQPKREWSARLSRPTLNIYLRDIRENVKLRATTPGGTYTRMDNVARFERDAVRIELAYMMTAWAKDPLDEHRILSRLLSALFRFRGLPQAITAEFLPEQPADIVFKVAQPESTVSANDLWSVLDNEMRPFIDVIAQLAIFPHTEQVFPLVRSVEVTLVQSRQNRRPAPGPGEQGTPPPVAPLSPTVIGLPAGPSASDLQAPGSTRLPVRVQQVPNGKTPAAKRSSPPWPPELGSVGGSGTKGGSDTPPAPPPSSDKPKGGKGSK